ncbi:folate-binding protein YgfZ [Mesorhizobium sp. Z1-4]|uniref:CAF17-like 4Fe-4S cluster assembly/insertion protein YgfZ n=1 Tax=Mesorhizobium sp. Z1-4 TaxID=2448478 RepID=UPI000FD9D55E|nr:folate-binding protein YgfZ [Mesorhizobium sp. Z1-4]
MPTAHITDRALILATGPDARPFLQNLITTDIESMVDGEIRPGALLTPQGKILFDFLISRYGADGLRLECRADAADDFLRRLMLYKLRAKVEIDKQEQPVVAVAWEIDSSTSRDDSSWLRDTRFADIDVRRSYHEAPAADATADAYAALRVAHGVAESGADYALGDAFPHDVLFDQNGGVGLKKGCFVGQEVVSRMHHRGTARRRLLLASADTPLPPAGTDIDAGGRAVGVLGTVAGAKGLAIARIDKVKAARDAGTVLAAGGIPLKLEIPGWATFTFPDKDTGTD